LSYAHIILGAAVFAAACTAAPAGSQSPQTVSETPPPLPSSASILAASCSGCHSAGSAPATPSLAGRSADEIAAGVMAYKSDQSGTTVMHRIARGYTQAEIETISAYLGGAAE
tara:strand:+ start:35974 stop:36312 length:339 start_codon:yes stop_codon:yes gene_type:complete